MTPSSKENPMDKGKDEESGGGPMDKGNMMGKGK